MEIGETSSKTTVAWHSLSKNRWKSFGKHRFKQCQVF